MVLQGRFVLTKNDIMHSAIANKNRSNAVTAKVKRLLLRNGGENGIRSLSRTLGIAVDCGGASVVTKDTFLAALQEHQVTLSVDDVQAVWSEYDRLGVGTIDPVDFIASLRSGLSAPRRTLIERAWEVLPKDHAGAVELRTLLRRFDPSGHPDVVRGSRTTADVKDAFEKSFSTTSNPDGALTKQEFEQYYAAVSASMEDDDLFASLMRGCWHTAGADAYFTSTLALTSGTKEKSFYAIQSLNVKQTVTERMQQLETLATIVASHRNTLLAAKRGFRSLGRLIRARDVERTGYLSTADFLDALWQNRLYVEDKSLLGLLDTNNDNTVDVYLYMNMVVQELPPARRCMLERLWASFPTDERNEVDIATIHKRFHAQDGHALNAFLDAWDKRQVPSGRVGFKELVEWYAPLSATCSMDLTFEQTIQSEWN